MLPWPWVVAFLILAPIGAGIAAGIVVDAWLSLRDLRRGIDVDC